jgi:hypothetical protein
MATQQEEYADQFGGLIHTQLVPYLTELTDAELATQPDPADSMFLQGLMSLYESASFEEIGDRDELDIEDLIVIELRDKVVQRAARYLADHIMTAWLSTIEWRVRHGWRVLLADFGPTMLPPGCEQRCYAEYEEQVGFDLDDLDGEDRSFWEAEPVTTVIAFTKEQFLELLRRVRAALPEGQSIPEPALCWLQLEGHLRFD